MDLFVITKKFDTYDILHKNEIKSRESNLTETIKNYLPSYFKPTVYTKPIELAPLGSYREFLLYNRYLPADVQYEIMSNMVNLTSLITYKKYCSVAAFNEVAKFHLAKYNLTIHENHTRTWLTIMWNNFLAEANGNDIYDIIDNNMQSYFKWKKRISQLSILITIITGIFTIWLNIYTYIKIYYFTSATVIPFLVSQGTLLDTYLSALPYMHHAMEGVHWVYQNMGTLYLVSIIMSICTSYRIFPVLCKVFNFMLFKLTFLPFKVASKCTSFTYQFGLSLTAFVGTCCSYILDYYYQDGLTQDKEKFIQDVIDY